MKLDGINVEGTRSIQLSERMKNGSWNLKNRTIDVTFASETPILLTRDGELFYEVLSCEPEHVQLRRLEEGAPVLDDHNKYGIGSVLGTTYNPVVENKQLAVSLRFSKRKALDELIQDIDDKIISSVSCGYRVFKYRDITQPEDKHPTYLAVDWEPFEVSLVPVPFDINGKTRSMPANEDIEPIIEKPGEEAPAVQVEPEPVAEIEPETQTELPMEGLTDDKGKAKGSALTPEEITGAERTRSIEIRNQAKAAGLDSDHALDAIEKGVTIDQYRSMVIEELTTKKNGTEGIKGKTTPAPAITTDAIEKTRGIMEIGLCRKLGIETEALDHNALSESEQYRSMSASDMARTYMHAAGLDNMATISTPELAKRALISSSSADFPILLEGAARRKLLAAYAIIPDSWSKIAVEGSVADFREYRRLRGGVLGDLLEIPENGEYSTMEIPDGSYESVMISTFGRQVNLTRKMIINDDLGAFVNLVDQLGRAAKRKMEKNFWAMFAMNAGRGPLMNDGKALFHVDHKNLITGGGALSIASLKAMKFALSQQMDAQNQDYLDLTLKTLIVNNILEDEANLINDSKFDWNNDAREKPNTVRGLFKEIVASPRVPSQTAFYGMADKNVYPTFEMTFLNGQKEPFLESRNEFDVDGIRWKVRHDFGTAAIDTKGIQKNEA